MNESKLKMISNFFEGKEIRSIWDSEKEDYYFSVVDVIFVLTESKIPKRYWTDLKRKLEKELGRTVISRSNALNYKYIDNEKLIEEN